MSARAAGRPADAGLAAPAPASTLPWWAVDGIGAGPEGLEIAREPVARLAMTHGTPLYVYSLARVRRQVEKLRAALGTLPVPGRIYYAVKANRHHAILAALRDEGVGVDACSPREVELAIHAGFPVKMLSVTASMLSNRDLDAFARRGVHVNLDSLSALRRYAARVPDGTAVGLRVDPLGVRENGSNTWYLGSKFGLPPEQFDDALDVAREGGLVVDTLHVHCGWDLQRMDAPSIAATFAGLAHLAERVPTLTLINVGGGLGVRHLEGEAPLGLDEWTALLREHIAPVGLPIACEPGTFLVAESGMLVVEVNTVESKRGRTWLGVDAGQAVNVYPGLYDLPLQIVHAGRPYDAATTTYAVAGNINEAGDVFAEAALLPDVTEGDLLALLPTGAYGASMASDHCLRGWAAEVAL